MSEHPRISKHRKIAIKSMILENEIKIALYGKKQKMLMTEEFFFI